MGEFFKGWRRKTGLVMLAMACVLFVGWMRSYVFLDCLVLVIDDDQPTSHSIDSGSGCLGWSRSFDKRPEKQGTGASRYPAIAWMSWVNSPENWWLDAARWDDVPSESFVWRYRHAGFSVGEVEISSGRISFAITPYWSLILPLTLLSAWLILGKRSKAKVGG